MKIQLNEMPPLHECRTYEGWRESGRQVSKGERYCRTDAITGERLFHIDQTYSIEREDQTEQDYADQLDCYDRFDYERRYDRRYEQQ